jgi:ubiquinone biosynthesis protein UbiJ
MRLAASVANRLLARDTWARHQLAVHAGKVARVKLGPVRADFRITSDGQLLGLTIAVDGDPDLGATLVGIAKVTPWLAESELARLTGPIAANRIANALRTAIRAPREAAERLGAQTRAFVSQENELLARRGEVERHRTAIAELSARLDALEQRAEALRARQGKPSDG